ncbi:MAG: glycosyltransferase family 9 protein [Mariprofundaceae bacterium]|nr:glycosyltransferase family 9 protein [Mariprofundaceae bacterium]
MKVLIVKLSAFGDIIHALPALHDLIQQPDVDEIHWLLDSRFAFAAALFPETVKVHKVALKGNAPLRDAWNIIRTLRKEQFDLIFDLQGLIKSGIMARAIGANVFGFDARQSPEKPNRFFVHSVPFHQDDRHVVQLYRRIAAAPFTGAAGSAHAMAYTPPAVHVTDSMRQQGEAALSEIGISGSFSILHVGGSYPTKRIPDGHWPSIAAELSGAGQVLVLWGNRDEQLRAEMACSVSPNVVTTRQMLPISAVAGLLERADAYIGQDTGVTHLAAAVGCPTVCLWGPTAPWRMGALGAEHRHVVAQVSCGPCFKRACDQFICMPSIRPEHIIAAWREVKR